MLYVSSHPRSLSRFAAPLQEKGQPGSFPLISLHFGVGLVTLPVLLMSTIMSGLRCYSGSIPYLLVKHPAARACISSTPVEALE